MRQTATPPDSAEDDRERRVSDPEELGFSFGMPLVVM